MYLISMLHFEAGLVIAIVLFIIVSLFLNKIGAGLTFTIAVAILGIFQVLTPREMISGFANEQLAIIIMLLVLGDVLKKSSLFIDVFNKLFMTVKSYRMFLIRMSISVAGLSAFLNNTPLVAIMMPFVHSWGKKYNVSSSKLLIPLSFAAILGGCATLIGTSTNLFVNGLVTDQNIIPGLESLNIFDFTPVGVIMIVIGIIYLVLFSRRLLPDRKDLMEDLTSKSREYVVEVRVKGDSGLHGMTVEKADLRNLKGLYLIEILRGNQLISPVSPTTEIHRNDVLIFAGETESITELVESGEELVMTQVESLGSKGQSEVIEVVISHNSTLIASTAKQINFRGRYDAAIIAVHRNGERVSGKIGEVKLEAGDVLLLIAGDDFSKRVHDHSDFYVISKIKDLKKQTGLNNGILIGGLISVVVLAALNVFSLFNGLLGFIILLMVVGIISPKSIAKSIDFNLIIIIALSLALAIAMVKTGVAESAAHIIFETLKPLGIVGLFAGIFILTNVLGALITNKAAVALLFPIVLSIATELQMNPKPFVLLIAFAGAASFLTPIGYQTNLMVYGPGGYKFADFLKIGAPLTFLYMVVVVAVLILQFNLSIF